MSKATVTRVLRSPTLFLAFGLGSGLSPRAPGTAGTFVALLLYLPMARWGLPAYSALVVAATLFGIWLCGRASRLLGVHDHPGIVWDEFVGYWITVWALPGEAMWLAAGFVVFRIYDIAKPWPIGQLDRGVSGGLGIMLDDIVAGVMACATLHLALWMAGA